MWLASALLSGILEALKWLIIPQGCFSLRFCSLMLDLYRNNDKLCSHRAWLLLEPRVVYSFWAGNHTQSHHFRITLCPLEGCSWPFSVHCEILSCFSLLDINYTHLLPKLLALPPLLTNLKIVVDTDSIWEHGSRDSLMPLRLMDLFCDMHHKNQTCAPCDSYTGLTCSVFAQDFTTKGSVFYHACAEGSKTQRVRVTLQRSHDDP